MAYNNGFPVGFNYYQQPMPQPIQPMPQQVMPQQVQQPQQQMPMGNQQQYPVVQNGFVRVRSENEARMFPVAPANSVTFVDESSPYVYTKTVNMGQLDRPIFEKYRLVKEDEEAPVEAPSKPVEPSKVDMGKYATKDDVEAYKADLEAIRADIETIRGDLYGLAGKKKATAKKEVSTDE